jgi:hypothetical protein
VLVDGEDHDCGRCGARQKFERWQEQSAQEDEAIAVENGWYLGEKRIVKEEVRFSVAAATKTTHDRRQVTHGIDQPVGLAGAQAKATAD